MRIYERMGGGHRDNARTGVGQYSVKAGHPTGGRSVGAWVPSMPGRERDDMSCVVFLHVLGPGKQ